MESPHVYVIDSSPVIRETIAIILGNAYDVQGVTPEAYLRDAAHIHQADLIIIADNALPVEALATVAQGPPILWLQSRPGLPPVTTGSWAALPRSFAPQDLRTLVRSLLSSSTQPPPATRTASFIDYPLVDKDVSLLAHRAARTQFPILICGQPGTGKSRLARTIHALGGGGRFVPLSAGSCNRAALERVGALVPGDLTAFVQDVTDIDLDAQQFLLELLDCGGFASASGWHRVRLSCATSLPFDEVAGRPGFDQALFYRLSVLPIALRPLRDRSADIPALVRHLADDLAQRLATEPITFTERAMDRLTHYLWFGNLAELETVLTRTVALSTVRIIDAEDLAFGYGRIVPRPRTAIAPEVSTAPASNQAVDLIINELAHEFKNPMVTIKTVAQHLERLLSDEAGREEVARLTGDAVDRMDRALENLLQFTRFRTPAPEEVTLNAMLAACLGELTPTLSERRLQLNYQPPEPSPVFVDSAQIVYAFENLVRVIARGLVEGQTLCVRPAAAAGAVVFECADSGHALAKRLARFLEHTPDAAESALPLGLVFARALVERNGGRIEISGAGEQATITVWLPTREEMVTGNGKATSLNS